MYRKRHRIFSLIMTVLAVTAVFCSAITLVLYLVPLYDVAAEKLDLPAVTGYSKEVIRKNYRILIDYNLLWGSKTLEFPDFPSSPSGLAHFKDVKMLFRNIQILAIIGIPLTFLGYLISKRNHEYSWMRNTCIVSVCLIGGLAASVWYNAAGTFIFMHKILFTNVYWQFNPEKDPVIKILPGKIFLLAAIEACVWILIALVILLIRCLVLSRRDRRPSKKQGKR